MRIHLYKHLVFPVALLLFTSLSSFAAHIIGSDISVQRLSANNYQITVTFFRDCAGAGAGFENPMYVFLYDKVTHAKIQEINVGAPTITTLTKGDACYTPALCVEKGVYVGTAVIANNPNGYYLSWMRCCRNNGIANIISPGNEGSIFYAEIPDPAIANSTPVFNTVPQGTQGYMCASYTNYVDFSATDADGDQLVYSLSAPLSCNPTAQCDAINNSPNFSGATGLQGPYGTITWGAGYSTSNPFGVGTTTLSATSGLLTVNPPTLGVFVLCVKVEEYRGGIKIGEVRRDFQFEVLNCQRLNISVVPTTTVCVGQVATLNATGALAGWTYTWSPGGMTGPTITGISMVNGTTTYTAVASNGVNCIMNTGAFITNSPTAAVATSGNVCLGQNTTLTASGGTSYVWSNGTSASVLTGVANNTYTVIATNANGCTDDATGVVYQAPVLTSTVSVTNTPCIGNPASATISASNGSPGYTYSWTSGGQTTQIATGIGTGNYSITVTDSRGCTSVKSFSVSVTASPTLAVTASPGGCGVSIGSATVSPTGGGGAPYTYLWANGQTTQSATGLSTGNYSVTVTSANGCTSVATASITASGAPSISNISSSSFGCASPYGVATVSVFGGTPGYNYIWTPGGQTTQTVSGLTSGNYSVTVSDANNCTVSTTISVTVTPPPAVTAVSSQATCGNNNGTATANPTGGTPGYTYQWSNGETTATISNLAPGNYSVTISDNSCNISGIELVTNGDFSAGNLGFTSTYTACVPNCSEGSYAVGTDPNAVHVAWSSCGDHTSGTGNFMIVNGAATPGVDVWCQTVAVTPNTNYTFSTWVVSQYTISPSQLQFSINGNPLCSVFSAPPSLCSWQQFFCTWNSGSSTSANICILNQNTIASGNDFGLDDISFQSCTPCTATATVTVTQPSVLATTVSQTNLLCNGANNGSATVNPISGTPAYTYNWSNGQSTSAVSGLVAGNYSVTVTDLNGCTSTNTLAITQPTLLSSSSSQSTILCNGGTASASVSTSGGTPSYTYAWNNGQTTSALSGIAAGNYSVIITDANGCTNTNTFSISQPAVLTSGITQTTISCNGGTGTASVSAGGGTPAYSYNWSNGQSTSTIAGITAGNYSVLVTDANGCTSQAAVTLTQPPALLLSVSGNDSICSGDTAVLSATASGGVPAYTYLWVPGPQNSQSISVSPSASTTYSVIITDANGCTSSLQTFSVAMFPNPNALFDTTSNGMYGSIYSFGDLSSGATSWFWDFGDGSTSTSQSPIHTFPGSGTYTVTQVVFNQFGCPDTFKIVLDFEDGILVPNVFTPDGDGINDVWFVPNSGLREYHVEIYDRWGLKVFESTADQIRWDGRTTAGVLLSDGTYYYVLTAVLKSFQGDKDYSTKGYVTLLTQKRKQ